MVNQCRKQGLTLRNNRCSPLWISGEYLPGRGVRPTGVGICILQLTGCEALGKLFHLSELQLPHERNEDRACAVTD